MSALESCIFLTYLNHNIKTMEDNKRKYAPSTAQKEERMSRCKRVTGVRLGPGTDASAVTLTNPLTDSQEILCDCGEMCKGSRGLKIHQAKTDCQMPENKLIAPARNFFISLNDVILSLCSTFENTIFYKTSNNKFISISDAERPVSSNKCFVCTTKRYYC